MLIKSSVALLLLSMAGAGGIGTATGVGAHKTVNRVSNKRVDNKADTIRQSTADIIRDKSASAKLAAGH